MSQIQAELANITIGECQLVTLDVMEATTSQANADIASSYSNAEERYKHHLLVSNFQDELTKPWRISSEHWFRQSSSMIRLSWGGGGGSETRKLSGATFSAGMSMSSRSYRYGVSYSAPSIPGIDEAEFMFP